MASSVFKMIHSEKRSKIRDMNDVRTRASKRLKETRKSQREALLNLHRRVEIKPEVKRKKTEQEETLLRLKSYREEKLKRMEEQKKNQKPPFYSLVRVRHTGGTPFKSNQKGATNLMLTLPPVTRSRTAFQKEFVFKATLKSVEKNGSKPKEPLPAKLTKKGGKENVEPVRSNLKMTTKSTVKAALVKDAPKGNSRKAIVIPTAARSTRQQKEISASAVNTRPKGQRQISNNKNNVAVSTFNDGQKKKNMVKSKSDLVSKTASVGDGKKGTGVISKNLSKSSEKLCSGVSSKIKKVELKKNEDKANSQEYKLDETVNHLLADKLAERVFIMSPIVTANSNGVVTRSTRRRPRPSTGNLTPIERKIENSAEKETSENNETGRKAVDENSVGPEALRKKLEEETARLKEEADRWWERQEGEEGERMGEQVRDEVLAVVGQTRLLLGDKFKQFSSLLGRAIAQPQYSSSVDIVIKPADLLGFWEMMYLEVEQLNKKYENLERLAENRWCPLQEAKTVRNGKARKKVNAKKPAASASSKFKEFLKKKKGEEANNEEFNNTISQDTPEKRAPSLMRALRSEGRSRRSSACSITLQKSFLAKAVLSPIVK